MLVKRGAGGEGSQVPSTQVIKKDKKKCVKKTYSTGQ